MATAKDVYGGGEFKLLKDDYEKEIIAKESSYEAIKKPNIEAAIECMNSSLKINIHTSMSLIRNAIDKSISIGNTDLIKATVNAMIKYVDNTIESKDYCISEALKFIFSLVMIT